MKRKRSQRTVRVETVPATEAPSTTTFELFIARPPTSSAPRYRVSMRTKEKV
jgi:hypothetical protein